MFPVAARFPAPAVGTVGIDRQVFTVAGQPWTMIESSEFSLYKRYLDGEDIGPVLTERAALGFNTLRVWLLNTSVIPGGLEPKHYPDFYARLGPFTDAMNAAGFVVEHTAFTQTQTLMPSKADQIAHWTAVQDAVRGKAVLLELVNEYDEHDNRTDQALLSMRPVGIVASSGSAGADNPPPTPVWDYVLYHSNGLDQWQRKVGHNAMEWGDTYHVPAASNENTRYPDQDSSEQHAFDAAAGAALLCGGACFHSNGGKLSQPFSDVERRCAAAWVAGAQSVPLAFQHGAYHHRNDLEGGTVIRAYDRTLADGRAHVVLIHA